MGNTHDTEVARIEADYIKTRWKTNSDYRWGYNKDRGPDTWWLFYPSASGGNQSPVDIIREEVHTDTDTTRPPLQINYGWNKSETRELINTGNTARVNITNGSSHVTEGPCKSFTYTLEQFHLHWGELDTAGSEHHVDSIPYSAELHLVHYNSDLYDTYEEATRRDDGIIILAVFLKLSDSGSSQAIQKITERVDDIIYREQKLMIPADELDITSLLPDNTSRYWYYRGSFTTPPCYETVTWIVLQDPIFITSQQLGRFRLLRTYCESEMRPSDEHDGHICRNIRPIQPRGTRKVLSVDDEELYADAVLSGYLNLSGDAPFAGEFDHSHSEMEFGGERTLDRLSSAAQRRSELYQWH